MVWSPAVAADEPAPASASASAAAAGGGRFQASSEHGVVAAARREG